MSQLTKMFDKIQKIVDSEMSRLHADLSGVGFDSEVMAAWDRILTDIEDLVFGGETDGLEETEVNTSDF